MHVANIQIPAENGDWQNLETLISNKLGSTFTFDSSKTYFLVNCSNTDIYLINTTETLTTLNNNKINGIRLSPCNQAGLKKDSGYVYCKCLFNISADLHIEVKE